MPTPLVADAIAHYNDLLGTFDPATWWSEHRDDFIHRGFAGPPPSAFALRPMLIDETTYANVKASVSQVLRGFAIIVDRLAADETLRRAVHIPKYMEPLLELDLANGRPPTLGRIDGHMSSDGLKLIEFNSEPQTAAFQYEIERASERLPISREFAKRYKVRTIDLYEQTYASLDGRIRDGRMPCIAIIDKPLAAEIFRPLVYCAARGAPILYAAPEELEYRNGKVTANGIEIDLVAFPDWGLLINARKRLTTVLKAIAEGAVQVYAGLSRGLLASYKTVFELLSSPEYSSLFPPEVNEALARHIPWTRVLRERKTDHAGTEIDLLPYVAAHRELLVIKPAGGSGGKNIHIGRDLSDDAWTQAIQRGIQQNWIVQALAVPERQTFPVVTIAPDGSGSVGVHELNCELTPYVWNGTQVEGVLCRVVAGSVLMNLGDQPVGLANGIVTPTWIIDRS
jgi:hypothetical protein